MSKVIKFFCTLILVLSFVGVSIQSVSGSLDDPFDYDPPDYDSLGDGSDDDPECESNEDCGEADPNSPSMPCCVEGECGECDNPNYLGDPSEGCEGVVCQDCETCARGVCYDDCPLGEMCEDDECVENMIGGCTTDADCGFGGTCVSGACSDGCDDALCNSDCQADGFDGGSCTPDGEFSCTCTGAPDDSDDEGDDVLPPAPDDCEDAECNSDCQMRGYEEGGSCVAEGEGLVCECAGAGPDDSDDTGCTYPCSSDSDCDAFADPEHPSTAACVDGCCEN